jgi:imidazolonepropionase-like amidohydrolase
VDDLKTAGVGGSVPGERVAGEITFAKEPLAVLPDQRWHLPGLVFGEQRDQSFGVHVAVGGDKAARAFGTFHQFVLDGRTRFEDAGEAAWKDHTWPMFTTDILKDMDTDPLPIREKFTDKELEIVGAMHRAGVPFLAGTDTAAGVHVFPGFSLHEELEYFVRAGFTPLEALQTATSNPARFLDRADMGTVQKGKLADLVLLDADPLADIRNTRKIRAVVLNGRYLSRADLDNLLHDAEVAAASQ